MGISREQVRMMGTHAQQRINEELAKDYPTPGKRSKYGNKRVTVEIDGVVHKFDSKAEMRRFHDLRRLEAAGLISGIKRQTAFRLHVRGFHVCDYRADFTYYDAENTLVVEDVKGGDGKSGDGTMTPLSALKIKLMKACLDIDVRIVSA